MYYKLRSYGSSGMVSYPIEIEATMENGLPVFLILGIPERLSRDLKERIRAALFAIGFPLPPQKILVNLSANYPITSISGLDLPIILTLLRSQGLIPLPDPEFPEEIPVFLSSIGLNGELHGTRDLLPRLLDACNEGRKFFFLSTEDAAAANIALLTEDENRKVYLFDSLEGVVSALKFHTLPDPLVCRIPNFNTPSTASLSSIRGQALGKRALEIACAGYHNLLLCGPPGCGKTLLLSSAASLLPEPSLSVKQQILSIHSQEDTFTRPCRQIHHSITTPAFIGGGNPLVPGELTKATGGILLLDEMAEFSRPVLENLRQPLESHRISLHFVHDSQDLPADFMLLGTMNLCPCGFYPDMERCSCTSSQIRRYQARLGNPLLERIELCLGLTAITDHDTATLSSEDIRAIKDRIQEAVLRQHRRYLDEPWELNSRVPSYAIKRYCSLDSKSEQILSDASKKLGFSLRIQHNIIKTARSIADLAGCETIEPLHISEALSYRPTGFLFTDQNSSK